MLRAATTGATFGATLALAWMTAIVTRAAWTMTRAHRWRDLKQL